MAEQWEVLVHERKIGSIQFVARPPLYIQGYDNTERLLDYYNKLDLYCENYFVTACRIAEDGTLNLDMEAEL